MILTMPIRPLSLAESPNLELTNRRAGYGCGEPLIVHPLFDRGDVGVGVAGAFVDLLQKQLRPGDSAPGGMLCNLLTMDGQCRSDLDEIGIHRDTCRQAVVFEWVDGQLFGVGPVAQEMADLAHGGLDFGRAVSAN